MVLPYWHRLCWGRPLVRCAGARARCVRAVPRTPLYIMGSATFFSALVRGTIFVGQVGMICAGIQNAQGKACLGEIHGHRLHIRVGRVRKINGNNIANAGSHLIHHVFPWCDHRVQ